MTWVSDLSTLAEKATPGPWRGGDVTAPNDWKPRATCSSDGASGVNILDGDVMANPILTLIVAIFAACYLIAAFKILRYLIHKMENSDG